MSMMPMMPRCACRGEQRRRGRVQCRPPHLGMTLKRLLDGARRIAVYPRSPAGPSRRIAEKVARGVDALANALSARRASEGLSMAWRFSAVSHAGIGCGATNHIPDFPSGTNARLAAFYPPHPLTGHRLPLVSRGERDTTGTVLWAWLVETLGNFGRTRRRQGHRHATTSRHLSAGVECGFKTWPQAVVRRQGRKRDCFVNRGG